MGLRRPPARWLPWLLAVALLGLGGCERGEERFREHLARADDHIAAGKAEDALLELRSALQLRPESAEVNLRIAEVLVSQGVVRDAAFFYGEAHRLDPQSVEALLGETLIVMFDEPDRAEELVERALEIDPSRARAHAVRADLALVRGDTETALSAALTAVELEPRNPDWHMQLGIVEQARIRERQAEKEEIPDRQYERAMQAFEKARELYDGPGHWKPVFQRARVLAAWPERSGEASAAFRRAAEEAALTPRPGEQRRALRRVLDHARAVNDVALRAWVLERLTEVDTASVAPWRELAQLEEAAGRPAQPIYDRMLKRRPRDTNAHLLYAQSRADAGDVEGAIAHLRGVADEVDEPAVLRAGLIDALRGAQRGEEADAVLAELEARFPDDPHTALARAQQAIAEGRFDEAAEILLATAGQTPRSAPYRLLAQAELARGNQQAAIAAADRYLASAPEPAEELLSLKAQAQLGAGDTAGALATLREIARGIRPLTAAERLMAARAYYRLGQDAHGRTVIEKLVVREDAPLEASLFYARREGARSPGRVYAALERAYARAPGEPRLAFELTRLDVAAGRSDAALARLQEIEARDSELPPLLLLARAQTLAARGEEDAARRDALAAAQRDPGLPGALSLLVALHQRGGDPDQAIAAIEEIARGTELDARGLTLLGRLELQAGREDRARQRFEEALEQEADLPTTQNDLAYLLAKEGVELDRALSLAQRAQESLPEDPNSADTLGYVYLRKGLHQPAADQFRHALQLAEARGAERPEYHYHLGLALRGLGREADAAEALTAALELDGSFSDAAAARRELEAARAAVAEDAGGDARASSS